MKLNLENVDGFVVDLTWNVNVKQQYKEIFGESENVSIEDMRQAIIDYYTLLYLIFQLYFQKKSTNK